MNDSKFSSIEINISKFGQFSNIIWYKLQKLITKIGLPFRGTKNVIVLSILSSLKKLQIKTLNLFQGPDLRKW